VTTYSGRAAAAAWQSLFCVASDAVGRLRMGGKCLGKSGEGLVFSRFFSLIQKMWSRKPAIVARASQVMYCTTPRKIGLRLKAAPRNCRKVNGMANLRRLVIAHTRSSRR